MWICPRHTQGSPNFCGFNVTWFPPKIHAQKMRHASHFVAWPPALLIMTLLKSSPSIPTPFQLSIISSLISLWPTHLAYLLRLSFRLNISTQTTPASLWGLEGPAGITCRDWPRRQSQDTEKSQYHHTIWLNEHVFVVKGNRHFEWIHKSWKWQMVYLQ